METNKNRNLIAGAFIVLGVALAVILGLAIRGGDSAERSEDKTEQTDSWRTDYLDFVYANAPGGAYSRSDSQLVAFGQTVCDSIDDGMTIDEFLYQAEQAMAGQYVDNDTTMLIAAMTRGAITHICPQHSAWLDDII